jgi:predicted dehydrogenase
MFSSVAAVVGTGFIGPVHIEGLVRAGVRVKGVLGTAPEKSQGLASKWGLETAYANFEELLHDPEVTVVHLTSPNRFHFEQALAALNAGKHVLCEKPLAMNSRESAELIQAAKTSGLVTGVNYNVRYYPLVIELAEQIKRGDFGTIHHINGSYVQDWLHLPTDFNWRVLANEGGALRAMADIGTHWIDLISFLTGSTLAEVTADLHTVYPIRQRPAGGVETFSGKIGSRSDLVDVAVDTDDYGSILFRLSNGTRGTLYVSQVVAGRKNCIRFEIAGQHKAAAWNSELPNSLWIGNRSEPNQELIRDPSLMGDRARRYSDYPGGHNEGFPDTFKQLFRDFYSSIERWKAGTLEPVTFPTFEDGHREIQICEAILESAKKKSWIAI